MRSAAYAVFCIVVIVGGAILLGGCATSDEVRLRMRLAEVTQERNDLLRFAVKQDGVVFIRCEEIAQVAPDPKQIKCLARIEGKPGMRFWFYFPAE